MQQQNLHTHTWFSDGSDAPESYIREAYAAGMTSVGFSDHSPLPFENSFALREERVEDYCREVGLLKSELQQEGSPMEVFLGMEVDFIPGYGRSFAWFRENYELDYLIGSVHLVRNGQPDDLWFIDGPDPATYDEGLNRLFGGDIRKGVAAYYRQINEMLTTQRMEIAGHLDKIRMHNRDRLFREDEAWYEALTVETLELVKHAGVVVEVNTRGIYKKRSDTTFPSPALLKKINALRIPVTISSDAHRPEEIGNLFGEAEQMLRSCGFREIATLTTSGWKFREL